MSDPQHQDLFSLVDECASLYAGPYDTIKQFLIENEAVLSEPDYTTHSNMDDILEYTDNFLNAINNRDIDEAEEHLSILRKHMRQTACSAARRIPEKQHEKLAKRRIKSDLLYSILLYNVPDLSHHQNVMSTVDTQMENADQLEEDQWQECVERYNECRRRLEGLLEATPSKYRLLLRLLALVGGIPSIIAFLFWISGHLSI